MAKILNQFGNELPDNQLIIKPPPPSTKGIVLNKQLNCYEIDGIQLQRVTHWIDQFEKPFNSLGASIGMSSSNNRKGVTNTMSPATRVHYWALTGERATSYGTGTHCFAEMYDIDPENTVPMFNKEYAVVKAITEYNKNYELIGNELKCYSKRYKLAGTIDRLLRHKVTKQYLIMDWKTSSDIDKSYNKYPVQPFKSYPQCKRSHYEIQLGVYRLLGNIILPSGKTLNIKDNEFDNSILIILNEDRTFTSEVCNTIPISVIKEALEDRVDPSYDIMCGV